MENQLRFLKKIQIGFLLFLFLPSAFAGDIYLFAKDGKPLDDYDRQVNLAKEGDFFVFPNKKKFEVKKFLGRGNRTNVFKVEEEGKTFALRLPKLDAADEVLLSKDEVLSSINDTIYGYKTLNSGGLPTVKIYDSQKRQYVLVGYVEPAFTLDRFLENPDLLPHEEKFEVRKKLMDFARKTAPFTRIGDFRFDQLAYDKKSGEWVLLDWMHSPDPRQRFDTSSPSFVDHIFNQNFRGSFRDGNSKSWSSQVLQEIDKEIRKERLRLNASTCSTQFESLK